VSFLQPWALAVSLGVAAAVVALHFLARRRPKAVLLPTTRFVPALSVRAPSRSTRPADLLLLAMRVLAVLLIGAAFARPIALPERAHLLRVVAVDVSRAALSPSAARDSAERYLRTGDLLVVFDSAARLVGGSARDSLASLTQSRAVGSLSAALAAALRAETVLRARADSVELVLISPFATEEWDAATARIRSLRQGRARLVQVDAAESSARPGTIQVVSPADDPLRAAAALIGAVEMVGAVRIERSAPERADTAWARASDRVLVRWPALTPDGWPPRKPADTAGAVVVGDVVVVGSFVRAANPPARGRRVVARWVDGVPAATERAFGEGCIRDVAITFPDRGDLAIGEGARRLVRALTQPCGGAARFAPLPDSLLTLLRGHSGLPDATSVAPQRAPASAAATWLLVAAAILLLAEPLARRRAARRGEGGGEA
jgi:hypothetical protein